MLWQSHVMNVNLEDNLELKMQIKQFQCEIKI